MTLSLLHGNHKGVQNQAEVLQRLLEKDVTHGFVLPITTECAAKLDGASWSPLNIADQWTVNEKGERIEKKRLTHNQYFPGIASKESINSQTKTEELEPVLYGIMLLRLLRIIHAYTLHAPSTPIFVGKYDLELAYCRLHMNTTSAVKCICSTAVCALIFLRLTFGGSFSPAEWCILIELTTNLANDIANNPAWCQHNTQATQSDPATLHIPIIQPTTNPFTPALPADISVPIPRHGWFDSYVDDIVSVSLDIKDNKIRTKKAILLTIFLITRPPNKDQHPIPHTYIHPFDEKMARRRDPGGN